MTEQPDAETLTQTLTDIWRSVLRDPEVEPDTSFFDAGGSSLTALRLRARIKDCCDVDVDLAAILDNSAPAELARLLAVGGSSGRS